jgi:hypothetical protein
VEIIEKENKRRCSIAGTRPVVHINDCCLSLSVLLLNPKTMRVFELARDTPTLLSLDAHKHMGAEKGISTVFGTPNTLTHVMEGKIRVGAEPSKGDVIRAILDLSCVSAKGYVKLYKHLQDVISKTTQTLEKAGLRQVRTAHRVYGSTVICFDDPSGAIGRKLKKRGFETSSIFNLYDGSKQESSNLSSALQLSVTPRVLRRIPGSGKIALDLFIEEAIKVKNEVESNTSIRITRNLFGKDALIPNLLTDNVDVYLFSKISKGGVWKDIGCLLARRYSSVLMDSGAFFVKTRTRHGLAFSLLCFYVLGIAFVAYNFIIPLFGIGIETYVFFAALFYTLWRLCC